MEDDMPDIPLDNFGAETEVATPPVASEPVVETPASEQTTPETNTTGSEPETAQPQPDNPIVEEDKSGRPEKQDRLQNRFGELTGKIRERDAELEKAQAMIAELTATSGIKPMQADENGQYSIEEIQRFQTEQANAIARNQVSGLRTELEREAIANRYDNEGSQIEAKYAEDFKANPIHLKIIQEQVDELIEMNRNNQTALKQISPLKIAERYMKGVESERRRAQSSSAANIEAIQAESAVLPDSGSAAVDPNSDDALEARVQDIKF